MPICRICGCEFKPNSSGGYGEEICSNDACWKQAWNDAIRPFKKNIQEDTGRKYRRVTNEERQQIIEMHKQGIRRREIAKELKIPYDNVGHIIRSYEAEREEETNI